MMGFLRAVFLVGFISFSVFSFADNKPGGIKGIVTLNNGKPAAYVSVMLKGSTKAPLQMKMVHLIYTT